MRGQQAIFPGGSGAALSQNGMNSEQKIINKVVNSRYLKPKIFPQPGAPAGPTSAKLKVWDHEESGSQWLIFSLEKPQQRARGSKAQEASVGGFEVRCQLAEGFLFEENGSTEASLCVI